MKADRPSFEVMASLQVMTCSGCGVLFAVPALLHLERCDQGGRIYCPNGHAVEVSRSEIEPDLLRQTIRQAAEIQALRHQVNTQRPATGGDKAAEISVLELKRRAALIVAHTERAEFGRKICQFCGNSCKGTYLKAHLLNHHRAEMTAMAAESFL